MVRWNKRCCLNGKCDRIRVVDDITTISLTEEQLSAVEDNSHETTLWYCDFCSKWFESKEDLLKHYIFPNPDTPEIYCDFKAGSETA